MSRTRPVVSRPSKRREGTLIAHAATPHAVAPSSQSFALLPPASAAAPAAATAAAAVEIVGVEPGQKGPSKRVRAKNVITCAGFYADRVAAAAGGARAPKVVTFRGTYYQMAQAYKDVVKTNVYPVPSGGGIPVGVHFTPTVNERRGHQMIVGPGACGRRSCRVGREIDGGCDRGTGALQAFAGALEPPSSRHRLANSTPRHAGACLTFSREGYKFWDVSPRDMFDSLFNVGFLRFAVANPGLSVGELWKDLNKKAFLREAQKLMPALTADMVEVRARRVSPR